MENNVLNKEELVAAIDEVAAELLNLLSTLDDDKINTVPYKDSWTAGQVIRHITKSTEGICKAISIKTDKLDRDPAEKIPMLQNVFLDLSTKMQSPAFIIPEDITYIKKESGETITKVFDGLKENLQGEDLSEVVNGIPFGEVSKLEVLHFILFHTQRHSAQLKRICEALNA